jgi:hypothetical protein
MMNHLQEITHIKSFSIVPTPLPHFTRKLLVLILLNFLRQKRKSLFSGSLALQYPQSWCHISEPGAVFDWLLVFKMLANREAFWGE